MPGKSADARFKTDPTALSTWKNKMQGVFNIVGVVREVRMNQIRTGPIETWWSSLTDRAPHAELFVDYMTIHHSTRKRYEEEAFYWWWGEDGRVEKRKGL